MMSFSMPAPQRPFDPTEPWRADTFYRNLVAQIQHAQRRAKVHGGVEAVTSLVTPFGTRLIIEMSYRNPNLLIFEVADDTSTQSVVVAHMDTVQIMIIQIMITFNPATPEKPRNPIGFRGEAKPDGNDPVPPTK
jgi:hypothetical protein